MPFDAATYQPADQTTDTVLRNLIDGRAMIADPSNWCRFHLEDGNQHCALGSLVVASQRINSGTSWRNVVRLMQDAAAEMNPTGIGAIGVVNDEMGHAGALSMYDRAISLRLAEMGGE